MTPPTLFKERDLREDARAGRLTDFTLPLGCVVGSRWDDVQAIEYYTSFLNHYPDPAAEVRQLVDAFHADALVMVNHFTTTDSRRLGIDHCRRRLRFTLFNLIQRYRIDPLKMEDSAP